LSVYEGLPPVPHFSAFLNSHVTHNKATEALTSSGNTINWSSWSATDTGKRRQYNEDSLLAKPESNLWVIADGMGGHKAGDVASQLIVNSLNRLPTAVSLEAGIHAVNQCLQQVNSELRQLARREYNHHIVGSTVVVLLCDLQRCAVLWAGDSRLYRLRANVLQQLTQDHSACHDDPVKSSNIITRAVGATDSLKLDCELFDVMKDDLFLLSSDGLDKEMSFTEIEQVMKTYAPKDIANILIKKTLAHGARDNVSVIVIDSTS
jgi:type VI secretion system protein ImpM